MTDSDFTSPDATLRTKAVMAVVVLVVGSVVIVSLFGFAFLTTANPDGGIEKFTIEDREKGCTLTVLYGNGTTRSYNYSESKCSDWKNRRSVNEVR